MKIMINENDIHTCNWGEWQKPDEDFARACYEYRVCMICGAVDAAGEPEEDEDDEDCRCSHRSCTPDFKEGGMFCDDCAELIRLLTDDEMENARVN